MESDRIKFQLSFLFLRLFSICLNHPYLKIFLLCFCLEKILQAFFAKMIFTKSKKWFDTSRNHFPLNKLSSKRSTSDQRPKLKQLHQREFTWKIMQFILMADWIALVISVYSCRCSRIQLVVSPECDEISAVFGRTWKLTNLNMNNNFL